MKPPILQGPRVTLRPITLNDAPTFVRWFSDPAIVRYMLPAIYKISLAKEKEYIKNVLKNKTDLIFCIISETGEFIGSTGIHLDSPENKVAGFGIVIGDKKYWGKGYAGECIELLGDYVFNKLKYNRWRLTVFVENKKAVKAYLKAGFKKEGRIRQNMLSRVDNKFHDEYVMSILRAEWAKGH